jgi:hypothetical protein
MSDKYVFYTLLKVDDCEKRLKEVINTNLAAREGFVGWVRKRKFRIESRDKYVKSPNRILHGELIEINDGTKIQCIWKLPFFLWVGYKVIMVILGVYAIMAVTLFINYVTGAFPSMVNSKREILSTLITTPFCIGFILLFKKMSKWQEEKVITKMKITLQIYKKEKK